MSELKLSPQANARAVESIKQYFESELDFEIGSFQAEFLIEFFAREIGPHLYNQGLADAHRLFAEKSEELSYLVQELEKPID